MQNRLLNYRTEENIAFSQVIKHISTLLSLYSIKRGVIICEKCSNAVAVKCLSGGYTRLFWSMYRFKHLFYYS